MTSSVVRRAGPWIASLERTAPQSLLLAVASVVAACISVAQQHFVFGTDNNVFHIPLVLRWADDPAFANDEFVQSLKNFVSPFWLGVRLVANESNVEWIFYLLHVSIRAAALAALTWAAAGMGIRGLLPSLLLPFWFGIVPSLRWETPIGGGQVFNITLSHSDLVAPLAVATITLAARGRYFPAFSTLGLIANVNAFATVWVGCALLGTASGSRMRATIIQSAKGLAVAAIVALPVAVWIFAVLQQYPVSAIEHERFLRDYFPHHSILSDPPARVALFAAEALVGLIGLRMLAREGDAWLRALAALCVLIVVGMILPNMVASRFLLDLHLIRASGLVQVLTVLGLSVAAISSLRSSIAEERIGGLLALFLLALPALQGVLFAGAVLFAAKRQDWLLPATLATLMVAVALASAYVWPMPVLLAAEIGATAAFLVLKPRLASWRAPGIEISVAATALMVIAVGLYTYDAHDALIGAPERGDAIKAAAWARTSTTAEAILLIPHGSPYTPYFQTLSRRRVWVDWKQGGAGMWAPSYYGVWARRMTEVGALRDLAAKMDYACKNNIDYVVTGPAALPPDEKASPSPVYRNDHFQIFDVHPWCSRTK